MSDAIQNIKSIKEGCERALQVLDKICEYDEPPISKELRITFNRLIKKCSDYLKEHQ